MSHDPTSKGSDNVDLLKFKLLQYIFRFMYYLFLVPFFCSLPIWNQVNKDKPQTKKDWIKFRIIS